MILTVATESDLVINIECGPQDTVAIVKDKVASQIGIPALQQQLFFQGRPLRNMQTMMSIGAADGDLLMLEHQPEQTAQSDADALSRLTGQQFIDQARANPDLMAQIDATNRQLAEAIRSNDGVRVEAFLNEAKEREIARQREMEQLMLNPMDIESQEKIMELIREKNVQENYQQALEHTPEMFGMVTMLYVNVEVNGVPVQAFVDTGAQMTIMTGEFAEKCSLMRLIDKRFAGMAFGVGQSKILGRVHQAPLKVGGEHLTTSLSVIEQKSGPPFIFGLDNLIRHQCVVDLKEMKLTIGSTRAEVPFLAEHQIDRKNENVEQQDSNAAAASSANGPPLEGRDSVTEEKVGRLMVLGFDRQRCVDALKATHGNEDAAAALLFGTD